MKYSTVKGPSVVPIHEGNHSAIESAYTKRFSVTAAAPRQPTPGSALANAELAALAARHKGR